MQKWLSMSSNQLELLISLVQLGKAFFEVESRASVPLKVLLESHDVLHWSVSLKIMPQLLADWPI
jgi:hypothetical protein